MIGLWLFAFALTLTIELPIYVAMLGRRRSSIGLALAVNVLTHPLLWFVFPRFSPLWLYIAIGELAVFAIEAAIVFAIVRHRSAVAAALVANAASYAIGNIVMAIVLT